MGEHYPFLPRNLGEGDRDKTLSIVEDYGVVYLRLFPKTVFRVVLAGETREPEVFSSADSLLEPKKKTGALKAVTPAAFETPASCTIFSSTTIASSSSPPTEDLTLPAESDRMMVQINPQAVKTGISRQLQENSDSNECKNIEVNGFMIEQA